MVAQLIITIDCPFLRSWKMSSSVSERMHQLVWGCLWWVFDGSVWVSVCTEPGGYSRLVEVLELHNPKLPPAQWQRRGGAAAESHLVISALLLLFLSSFPFDPAISTRCPPASCYHPHISFRHFSPPIWIELSRTRHQPFPQNLF